MCGLKYDVLIGSLQCCMITQAMRSRQFFKLEISSADIKNTLLHAACQKENPHLYFQQKKANVKAQLPKQHKA